MLQPCQLASFIKSSRVPEGELYYCPHPAALAIYFTPVTVVPYAAVAAGAALPGQPLAT